MAKLTEVRRRIEDMIVVQTGRDTALSDLKTGERNDDSLVVLYVAVPVARFEPDEFLQLVVNDEVTFSWPVEPLVTAYRRYTEMALPEALADVHETIRCISREVVGKWSQQQRQVELSDLLLKTEMLSQLMRTFAEAAGGFMTAPGVKLARSVLIPPRATIRAVATKGSSFKVYLRGLRSVEVR